MSSESKVKKSTEEIVMDWFGYLPNERGILSILDVDGFSVGHYKTEDIVGIIVVMPESSEGHTVEEAIDRLLSALKIILEICLGELRLVEKKKVVLYLTNSLRYFGATLNLTPSLTALMNSRSIQKDTSMEYTGTTSGYGRYLFELPYKGSTSDHDFACGKYVKVDLNNPDMQSKEVARFLRRIGYDFSVCRGQAYLKELIDAPKPGTILYLMFRNKVSNDEEWWKDSNNVRNLCAAVLAGIYPDDGSMILDFICSRPGTTGAVAEMLKHIATDARDTYKLNRLLLVPAGDKLRQVYQRHEYGFQECRGGADKGYMVKYLTTHEVATKKLRRADTEETGGGQRKRRGSIIYN
jgi:hypothetical protein